MPTHRSPGAQRSASPAPASAPPTALERVLAIIVVTCIGLALVGFAASLLHWGLAPSVEFFRGALWVNAFWLAMIALPVGFLALVAILAVSAFRKASSRR